MSLRPLAHIRRHLLRGLMLVLPLLITVWLLALLFGVTDQYVTPLVRRGLEALGVPRMEGRIARIGIPLIGLVLTTIFVYLLGVFAANITARKLVTWIESGIVRIPVVRSIYGPSRQLLDAFTVSGDRHFSRVVLVEYPRRGLWTIGLVTREARHTIGPSGSPPTVSVPVFLPTTPNPTSGWMILVPEEELIELDLSIEDGLKMVVSGGIVSPGDLASLIVGPVGPRGS